MRHLVGYIEGVWVSKKENLEYIMKRIAERNQFTVVNSAFHQFEPIGTTGVLVLAESHFSAHTYPEDNRVYIDVFCCSPNFDAKLCAKIIEEEFSAIHGVWQTINR